ncbi:MAG: hypothetical protein KKB38_20215, partial [Gammaproteobacteria bacterium]|nr:hypothetical protein [Gammaproteobacteria bacterium]
GKNICVGDIGVTIYNIYRQILIGARQVETQFIACCEDDALYNTEHFSYRPPEDTFAYNTNKWHVNPEIYFQRIRRGMCMCIAATDLLIETLETRFRKYPVPVTGNDLVGFGEPGRFEKKKGLPAVKIESFYSRIPALVFNHRPSMGGVRGLMPRDKIVRALPYWGDARELWDRYWNGSE